MLMDNPNCLLGVLRSTSAVDELVMSLRWKRQGRDYVISNGKMIEYQFLVQSAQLKDENTIKVVNPSLRFGRMIRIVSSEPSELKKKTKRGRR
jgi:hypothetical protein